MQSTIAFSYTQKKDGYLKGDRWPEFSSYGSRCRDFLQKKKPQLAAHFGDAEWVAKLAYLCDMFNLLNELNLSLQGKMTTVKLADKVAAFQAKLELWGRRMNRGIFYRFQRLAGVLEETEPETKFSQLVHDHSSLLLKVRALLPNQKRPPDFKRMDS